MAAVVSIISGRDVSIYTRHGSYPNKSKLALYKPLLHRKVTRRSTSVNKVGVVDVDV